MSSTPPKRPSGPPPSAGVLARYAQSYGREIGVAEGRVRGWVAYMVLAGLLERAADRGGGYKFTIKGGVALELRLRERARATKDIDLVLHDSHVDLTVALERATAEYSEERVVDGDQGFRFQRRRSPVSLDNGTVNVELAVTYRGGSWTTISVDIARAESGEEEVEMLDAVQFEETLGIVGPSRVPCLPLRFHIAQKIHGMTLPPRTGRHNERFKDLVDLMLMESMVSDYEGLREACELVFASRGTHGWPPPLELTAHWEKGYETLATDLGLPVVYAAEAMDRVRVLVGRICAAP